MEVNQLNETMGAEVTGIDLTQTLDDETKSAINKTFVDNLVACFRGQNFDSPDAFLKGAGYLGTPVAPILTNYLLPGQKEVEALTSDAHDKRVGGIVPQRRGLTWHTDHSNIAEPPKATMLYGIDIPSKGGDTQFINMYAAYDALSEDMKDFINGRRVLHVYQASRAPRKMGVRTKEQEDSSPGVWQPLVRLNPDTGRKALYLNDMRMEEVEGLSEKETTDLLKELLDHCIQPRFQYSHKWQKGDVLVWDNRSTLHQGSAGIDPSERRYLHRVMLQGEAPVLAN
ncbi:MAG: TauD/TfdA family dioxygenase [Rhodospirillaceae bacterium]|jgi:taurine dioxygenase|nr:TauD/TfdA family dioxygenase [Rhodospirillales bacterium]MBT3904079.1 TauD/TfdA family dioxygenase [Rhodospirillaceae bacterium]MBT4700995.1 TauD/TfdA family dioxygenase [Rhodospirillaceae bacterium]MBT5035521.1 TauD/TfdA family dioxygenase [Rhodospirillaceae bacterium]MBT6219281.1 TauD/TfdA family dioxygenase [Rhodospirillaceae bacterium]